MVNEASVRRGVSLLPPVEECEDEGLRNTARVQSRGLGEVWCVVVCGCVVSGVWCVVCGVWVWGARVGGVW